MTIFLLLRGLRVLPPTLVLAATCIYSQDLDSLPRYRPEQRVSGVIRNFGSPLGGMVKVWEKGFCQYHPDVRFEDRFPSSDGAIAGLISGAGDIGTSGREPVLTEYLAFYETHQCDPTEIAVATGAYDIKGRTWALVIFVHKDNPITKLTMKQLDGIFGAERTGGYSGYKWHPQLGRSARANIRRWGQLGLTGEWTDKPINTYGYAFTGMTNFFQLKVFKGGDKWNPNYRQYVEAGTKMVTDEAGSSYHMLAELSEDKYGIAWTGIPHARNYPQVKPIALAAREGGPYLEPTRENVQNRTYPLTRSVYMYLKQPPGQAVDPKVKEFLRYVLSREGQEAVVKERIYLPLTPEMVGQQLKKLE